MSTNRKEYSKMYYETHKEQAKEANRKYREMHKEECSKYRKEYYKKNKKRIYERQTEYRHKNAKAVSAMVLACKTRRVEKLRSEGVTNAWGVVNYQKEPKYKRGFNNEN